MNNLKRFFTYLAATLAFISTINSVFSRRISEKYLFIGLTIAVTLCCVFYLIEWLHSYANTTDKVERIQQAGGIGILSKNAFQQSSFADINNEEIAYLANRIVRHKLDKHCISYNDYKTWRNKNSNIFRAILSPNGQLIGFFDVFPLTDHYGELLYRGKIKESDLSQDAILPFSESSQCKYVYIASIMANPSQSYYSTLIAKEITILKLFEFIALNYPPVADRIIFAYAQTHFGERLLVNHQFLKTQLSNETKQRKPLYSIPYETYATIVDIYMNPFSNLAKSLRKRNRAKNLALCSST